MKIFENEFKLCLLFTPSPETEQFETLFTLFQYVFFWYWMLRLFMETAFKNAELKFIIRIYSATLIDSSKYFSFSIPNIYWRQKNTANSKMWKHRLKFSSWKIKIFITKLISLDVAEASAEGGKISSNWFEWRENHKLLFSFLRFKKIERVMRI